MMLLMAVGLSATAPLRFDVLGQLPFPRLCLHSVWRGGLRL